MDVSSRIKVLITHGESLIDAGLAATLSPHDDIDVVASCAHGAPVTALLERLAHEPADILITDYDRGMQVADALQRSRVPFRPVRPRIMLVTGRATQAEIQHALKQSIGGYLMTTSPSAEVIDAVRRVHLGVRHVSEPLLRLLLDDMTGEHLTPRETEVLRLAALGCANKVIAARLQVELGTVKCHMTAVLDKLGASNRTEAVVIAHRRGLLAPQAVGRGATVHRPLPLNDRKSRPGLGASPRPVHEDATSL